MKTLTIVMSIFVLATLHASTATVKYFKSDTGNINSPLSVFSTGGHNVAHSNGHVANCRLDTRISSSLKFKE